MSDKPVYHEKIDILALTGQYAVSYQSGAKLLELLNIVWPVYDTVTLDFSGVKVVAAPYLNSTIGSLLLSVSLDELLAKLRFEGVVEHHRDLINLVIHNALDFKKKNRLAS